MAPDLSLDVSLGCWSWGCSQLALQWFSTFRVSVVSKSISLKLKIGTNRLRSPQQPALQPAFQAHSSTLQPGPSQGFSQSQVPPCLASTPNPQQRVCILSCCSSVCLGAELGVRRVIIASVNAVVRKNMSSQKSMKDCTTRLGVAAYMPVASSAILFTSVRGVLLQRFDVARICVMFLQMPHPSRFKQATS